MAGPGLLLVQDSVLSLCRRDHSTLSSPTFLFRTLVSLCALVVSATAPPAQQLAADRAPGVVLKRDLSAFANALSPEVPREVASAIKAAPNIRNVLPVSGSESFGQQIIKADEIVFDARAHLVLTNIRAPWVAVVARRFKFRDPTVYSFIERDMNVRSGAAGRAGVSGTRGADDYGETNRRGNDGHPGGPGGTGGGGETLQLPTVYVIAEQLLDDRNQEIPAGILNLAVLASGIDGGAGGIGGRGGDGGNGKEGATGAFDCREGPGPGGNGGTAGPGGRGGDGAHGGNGGTIVFVSLRQGADTFTYARVNNQGGLGGNGGRGGSPGTPGREGNGAGRNGWCGPSGPGSPGTYPSPVNFGDGTLGHEGIKGEMFVIALQNLDPFF
jgi:hypothetical protein